MYSILLCLHSLLRWLVLSSLLYAIFRAYRGFRSGRPFTKTDDSVRHWTATIAHIQLMTGCLLYFNSPLIKLFFSSVGKPVMDASVSREITFFGMIHMSGMIAAIVVITIGSALARRKTNDREKFRAVLLWFSIALLIILIVIPWPFSPFANRPLFRSF